MSADLKVVYLLDSVEVKRNMTQLQLADLLKNDDVLLLSVNAPTVKHYRRKKEGWQIGGKIAHDLPDLSGKR